MTADTRPGPVDLEAGLDPAAIRWDPAGLVAGSCRTWRTGES